MFAQYSPGNARCFSSSWPKSWDSAGFWSTLSRPRRPVNPIIRTMPFSTMVTAPAPSTIFHELRVLRWDGDVPRCTTENSRQTLQPLVIGFKKQWWHLQCHFVELWKSLEDRSSNSPWWQTGGVGNPCRAKGQDNWRVATAPWNVNHAWSWNNCSRCPSSKLLLFDVAAMGHVCDDASAVDLTLSVEGSFSNLGTPGYHYYDLWSHMCSQAGSRSQLYSSAPPLTRKERTPFGNWGAWHMLEYHGTSLETDVNTCHVHHVALSENSAQFWQSRIIGSFPLTNRCSNPSSWRGHVEHFEAREAEHAPSHTANLEVSFKEREPMKRCTTACSALATSDWRPGFLPHGLCPTMRHPVSNRREVIKHGWKIHDKWRF